MGIYRPGFARIEGREPRPGAASQVSRHSFTVPRLLFSLHRFLASPSSSVPSKPLLLYAYLPQLPLICLSLQSRLLASPVHNPASVPAPFNSARRCRPSRAPSPERCPQGADVGSSALGGASEGAAGAAAWLHWCGPAVVERSGALVD